MNKRERLRWRSQGQNGWKGEASEGLNVGTKGSHSERTQQETDFTGRQAGTRDDKATQRTEARQGDCRGAQGG